ncbi:MAG: DUF2182 domain-containing protein [Sphaerobacter sp.]|nr:DUF2182 domain-containing protein [Sphaerobacter sp.]
MTTSASPAWSRERAVILGVLLVLAAVAWGILIWQGRSASDEAAMGGMGLTMGMGALLFLTIWVVMMVAMMFPTAAPMILTFAQVHAGRRARGQGYVPTWIFVGGYLAVWSLVGVVAYGAAVGVTNLATGNMWLMDHAARIGGAVLILAGLYQLSPLKRACLAKCRTPLAFVLGSWRDGARGALRMGVEHGSYCLGCCWLLFVILFPLGLMNVAVMATVTVLIFAEKALPIGPRLGQLAAAVLIAYGALALAMPELLPTTGM